MSDLQGALARAALFTPAAILTCITVATGVESHTMLMVQQACRQDCPLTVTATWLDRTQPWVHYVAPATIRPNRCNVDITGSV